MSPDIRLNHPKPGGSLNGLFIVCQGALPIKTTKLVTLIALGRFAAGWLGPDRHSRPAPLTI
jgi:hypothetical protein